MLSDVKYYKRSAAAKTADETRIIDARIAGKSLREIANETGISRSKCQRIVKKYIIEANKQNATQIDEYRNLGVARCEKMLSLMRDRIEAGDPRAVIAAVKVLDREAKYYGLDTQQEEPERKGVTLVVQECDFSDPDQIQIEDDTDRFSGYRWIPRAEYHAMLDKYGIPHPYNEEIWNRKQRERREQQDPAVTEPEQGRQQSPQQNDQLRTTAAEQGHGRCKIIDL